MLDVLERMRRESPLQRDRTCWQLTVLRLGRDLDPSTSPQQIRAWMPWAAITRVSEYVGRILSSLGNKLAKWDHVFCLVIDQPPLIPMPLLWRLHTRYADVERISVVEPVLSIVKECGFRDRAG